MVIWKQPVSLSRKKRRMASRLTKTDSTINHLARICKLYGHPGGGHLTSLITVI